MKPAIDSSKVKGEPGTGYEAAEGKGPFQCGNCHYFRPSEASCGQATMVQVSKLPRTTGGRVQVEAAGCCEYVERKGSARRTAFQDAAKRRAQR